MAITIYSGTVAENASNSTTLNVPYPTTAPGGILSTDILVLAVFLNNLNPATTPPGFTLLMESAAGAASPTTSARYKQAAGGETGNLSVTTPSTTSRGQLHVLRGVDLTTPIADTATEIERAAGNTNYNIPGQTMPATDCLLMYGAASNTTSGTFSTPSVPATFTELWDDTSPSPHSAHGYLIWSGSGATGTINLTRSSSIRGAAWLISFRPASGVTNYDRTATLAGTDTVTGVGVVGKVGAASITGTDAVAAAGVVGKTSTASIAGTDAVSAAATVGKVATAAVAATATIAASMVVGKAPDAEVEGAGSIAADVVLATSQTAALDGTGTLTAAATVGKAASASVEGEGSLSAASVRSLFADASLDGSGEIDAAAALSGADLEADAQVDGTGALEAAGTVGRMAAAQVPAIAVIDASALVGGYMGATVEGAAAIVATATVQGDVDTTPHEVTATADSARYAAVTQAARHTSVADPARHSASANHPALISEDT